MLHKQYKTKLVLVNKMFKCHICCSSIDRYHTVWLPERAAEKKSSLYVLIAQINFVTLLQKVFQFVLRFLPSNLCYGRQIAFLERLDFGFAHIYVALIACSSQSYKQNYEFRKPKENEFFAEFSLLDTLKKQQTFKHFVKSGQT